MEEYYYGNNDEGNNRGGLTFTASPATEIVVSTGYLVDRSNDENGLNDEFIIPNGVKVIEVYASAHIVDNTEHYIALDARSGNGKMWCSNTGITSVECTEYIGVTPNKRYHVYVDTDTRENEDCDIDRFYIKYSPEINNKTPTVTDY